MNDTVGTNIIHLGSPSGAVKAILGEKLATREKKTSLPDIATLQQDKTKNRLMVAFDSNKGPNLKVVRWS